MSWERGDERGVGDIRARVNTRLICREEYIKESLRRAIGNLCCVVSNDLRVRSFARATRRARAFLGLPRGELRTRGRRLHVSISYPTPYFSAPSPSAAREGEAGALLGLEIKFSGEKRRPLCESELRDEGSEFTQSAQISRKEARREVGRERGDYNAAVEIKSETESVAR